MDGNALAAKHVKLDFKLVHDGVSHLGGLVQRVRALNPVVKGGPRGIIIVLLKVWAVALQGLSGNGNGNAGLGKGAGEGGGASGPVASLPH